MRAVLISIKPKFCELIANRKKILDVRKTKPKIDVPFKCYIYCTQGVGKNTFCVPVSNKQLINHYIKTNSMESINCPIGNGKVIGEFVCDKIYQYSTSDIDGINISDDEIIHKSCLTKDELHKYEFSVETKENSVYRIGLYAWHISDLVIYYSPHELSEFTGLRATMFGYAPCKITRPPQSFCYVDELISCAGINDTDIYDGALENIY